MTKKYIDYTVDYAKREFDAAELKLEDMNFMIKFLKESANFTNNEPDYMKQLVLILSKILDRFPIVAITENDFVEEIYKEEGKPDYKIWRCTRYPYVYRTEDDRYWNDRAIAFKFKDELNSPNVFYTWKSKQEIFLPYYPEAKIEFLERS